MHSTAGDILEMLLKIDIEPEDVGFIRIVRYLFIKLVNQIDTSKQLVLFERIHRSLFTNLADLKDC